MSARREPYAYAVKVCRLCGISYTPTGPRQKRCATCRVALAARRIMVGFQPAGADREVVTRG